MDQALGHPAVQPHDLHRLGIADTRRQLYREQSGLCAYCRRPMIQPKRAGRHRHDDPRQATLDHVVPLSRGGTHDLDNLVVACRACNLAKGDRLVSPGEACA